MMHMARITGKNLREYVVRNASRKSRPHADESRICTANLSNFRTTRRFFVTRSKRTHSQRDPLLMRHCVARTC
jgi:hypothetical protein